MHGLGETQCPEYTEIDESLKQGVIDSIGREQLGTFATDSDVYSLIFYSKLPAAKEFKRWVTKVDLPSNLIRDQAVYITSQASTTNAPVSHATRGY